MARITTIRRNSFHISLYLDKCPSFYQASSRAGLSMAGVLFSSNPPGDVGLSSGKMARNRVAVFGSDVDGGTHGGGGGSRD